MVSDLAISFRPFVPRPVYRNQKGVMCSSSARLRKVGVVVVDHGSRKRESNDMLQVVVDLLKQNSCWTNVHPAHMEIAAPSISDAVSKPSSFPPHS